MTLLLHARTWRIWFWDIIADLRRRQVDENIDDLPEDQFAFRELVATEENS